MVKNLMGPSPVDLLRSRLSLDVSPTPASPDLTPAGVLVPLSSQEDGVHLLFTQRTLSVRDHRGQISFPGGVKDAADPSLLITALRETQEEIGLDPQAVEILGTLPPSTTITGYQITPFVGLIPHPFDFRTNPLEVERLLSILLTRFYEARYWSTGPYWYQGRTTRVCYWRDDGEVIWGATARILLHLLAQLGVHPIAGGHDATCLD